ncbi:hypothetical protein [Oceaniglobus trochenteri]|uniref:hypothetical protein n=1 Tax=Oceaniglobus trochenteri TaxID=2763260 RepID=UPI001CFFC011|nr:hypothetical protein [Oceaniglobus trochenteri]
MSFRFPAPATPAPPLRGAAPVGHLEELPPVELCAILYLRGWCHGGAHKDRIGADFRLVLDAEGADAAFGRFGDLMSSALSGCRRPLMRHSVDCRCFGGDECAFAHLIAAAAGGDNDDAMLFACTLLRPAAAFDVVQQANALGPVFLRLARNARCPDGEIHRPSPSTMKH